MHNFDTIVGVVVKGKQKGRILGFPTANLKLTDCQFESGAYAGRVHLNSKEYVTAIFIRKETNLLEAHILDFQGDLYGQEIEVEIGQKIREVVKFETTQELIEQIAKDVLQIRKTKS